MQHYDIRILKDDRHTSMLFEGMYLSDHSAIRAAKNMADGNTFEVWRGMDCIYGGHHATTSAPPVSRRRA